MMDGHGSLREAWSSWLGSMGFQAFYTQTFSEPCPYARLAMDRGWRILRALAGRYGVGVVAFLAAEQHKSGSYHVHGLVKTFPRDLLSLPGSLRFVWLLGFEEFGLCRFCYIEDIGGVSGYVAKYITKRLADYDFYRIDPP